MPVKLKDQSIKRPTGRWSRGAYLVAVLGSGLVAMARFAPEGLLRSFWASLVFLLAVSIAGALGGLKPGLLTSALSACVADFFLVRPYYSFWVANTGDALRIAGTALFGIAISVLCEALHQAWGRIEDRQIRLKEALRELRIVTDSMSAPVSRFSRNFCYLWVSKPYADWIGRSADEIVGRTVAEILGQAAFDQLRPHFERTLSGHEVRYEERAEFRGRGARWINAVDSPTFDSAGLVDGWVTLVIDVTERKNAEDALRASERREKERAAEFEAIMRATPTPIWIAHDPQCRHVTVNPAACTLLGVSEETYISATATNEDPGRRGFREYRGDTPVPVDELPLQRASRGVEVDATELKLVLDNGTVRYIYGNAVPLYDADGKVRGAVASFVDVTPLKEAEDALRRNQEVLKLVHQVGKIGHWEWNSLTDENEWSPEIEALYGLPPGGFTGGYEGWTKLIHPDDLPKAEQEVRNALKTGEYFTEFRVVWPDGSIHWLETRATVFTDGNDKPVRVVGVNMDVTERKRIEEALKEADRRKDEFLATLAHELRNPLAPICNAVELLQFAEGNSAALDQTRGILKRQLGHLVRLIDDLLEISRITRGKLQLRMERVELGAAIRSAVEETRPFINPLGHELTVALPPEPVYLEADPTRLAQILWNLLNNAAKYTERGGHIWLVGERVNGEVAVSVRDTGIGIAAEHLAGIFEMFSQVTPALERSQGGLGIGLALVRGLVELHCGTVEARSDGLGLGSEFIVRLPALEKSPVAGESDQGPRSPVACSTLAASTFAAMAATETSMPANGMPVREAGTTRGESASAQSDSGAKRRILVVDDNPDATASLAMILERMGHQIVIAHDGLEAVHAAATFRPDIVLLDIGLPKLNGYEAAERIRQQDCESKVALIALTGWGQHEDKRRAQQAGFDHHLTKPVDPAALQRLLATISPNVKT